MTNGTASEPVNGELEAPRYSWALALAVWLMFISALVILGTFVVVFQAMKDADRSASEAAIVGALGALVVATPYLVLTAIVYFMREMSVTLARLDLWAGATYQQAWESDLTDSERSYEE